MLNQVFPSINAIILLDFNLVKGERHEPTSSHYTTLCTSTSLDDLCSDCLHIARRTGFLKRLRKINPLLFLRALAITSFQAGPSFRLIALSLSLLSSRNITKQAVAKHMGRQCAEFVRCAVSALILKLSSAEKLRDAGIFHAFSRVLIQDSTQIRLPQHLADYFPGPANQNRKVGAAMKIQVVYNLLDETFTYFGLSGFRRTDQAASADILSVASTGDLVLRDLGYFAVPVFQTLIDRGVHFLTRLRQNVAILDPQSLKRVDLLKKLRNHRFFDQSILLGAERKVQVRLVALPVPEQIANERRRKTKSNRDKRLNPSKEDLELLGWNIYVTSVEPSIWSPETIQNVYGVRWRIEIIFKSWKSHFNLTMTATGSADQVEALIWAKLFAICLFQKIFAFFEHNTPTSISLLKSAQFFPLLLLSSLKDYITTALHSRLIDTHLRLEKRRKNGHLSPHRLLS